MLEFEMRISAFGLTTVQDIYLKRSNPAIFVDLRYSYLDDRLFLDQHRNFYYKINRVKTFRVKVKIFFITGIFN